MARRFAVQVDKHYLSWLTSSVSLQSSVTGRCRTPASRKDELNALIPANSLWVTEIRPTLFLDQHHYVAC